MKTTIAILMALLTAAAFPAHADDWSAWNRALASYAFPSGDGGTQTLSDLRGEVVVVNFWASWCKPCKREMPLLNGLHDRMKGLGRVVAVSVDREEKRVHRFIEENALTLPVYIDGPEGLASSLDLEFLPYTVVLDADGSVAFASAVTEGKSWNRLVGLVERLTTHVAVAPTRKVSSQ